VSEPAKKIHRIAGDPVQWLQEFLDVFKGHEGTVVGVCLLVATRDPDDHESSNVQIFSDWKNRMELVGQLQCLIHTLVEEALE
jgi:hypothetical protein